MTDTAPPAHASGPPSPALDGCAAATARLLERLGEIDDLVIRRPCRLPGWTVGHLLTHLARSADGMAQVLEAAAVGERLAQYPGGRPQRAADIEEGATRSAAACLNDVRRSAEHLETTFAEASDAVWESSGLGWEGEPWPCRQIPFRRWREVEFHHVDLGFGYEAEDWPEDFVSLALVDTLDVLPARIGELGQRARFLAWLAGRRDNPGVIDFAPF
jgi:maleylpyruvate isomerase